MSHTIALIHTWTTADLDGVWEGPPEFHRGSIVNSKWKDGTAKYLSLGKGAAGESGGGLVSSW